MNVPIDANAVTALSVPVLAPLITAGMKWLVPRMPGALIPTLCAAFGTGLAYIAQASLGADLTVTTKIALGMSGVCVREILDQLRKVNPDIPPEPTDPPK